MPTPQHQPAPHTVPDADLRPRELWVAYLAMSGTAPLYAVQDHLAGVRDLPPHEALVLQTTIADGFLR